MNEIDVIKALAALSHATRLRIFRKLVVAGPCGATPGDLCEQLEIPAATLSFHLKELSNACLVDTLRDGRKLIYSARFEQMNQVIGYLTENCCQGKSCLDTSTTTCQEAQCE